jgi:hypothetical protein
MPLIRTFPANASGILAGVGTKLALPAAIMHGRAEYTY